MEAEYIALFFGSQQAAWITQFQTLLGFPPERPIVIWCDSKSAVDVTAQQQSHKRSKHIDVKYHSIRERIADKTILVRHVSTKENTADVLTKSLSRDIFWYHVKGMNMFSHDGFPEMDLSFLKLDSPISSSSPESSSIEDF
jgi:hypothetical protein